MWSTRTFLAPNLQCCMYAGLWHKVIITLVLFGEQLRSVVLGSSKVLCSAAARCHAGATQGAMLRGSSWVLCRWAAVGVALWSVSGVLRLDAVLWSCSNRAVLWVSSRVLERSNEISFISAG